MAQVTRPRDDGGNHNRDRGQMILLMGVVLAVMFVALALLVNAAIYTDNVATRGGDPAGEALEYQNGVVDSVSGLLAEENDQTGGTTAADIEPAVDEIGDTHRQYHLRRGAAADTTVGSVNTGLFINESDVVKFENWGVTAASAREFNMTLNTTEMDEGNETSFYIDIGAEQLEVNKTGGSLVVKGGSENVECDVEANGDIEFNVSSELLGGGSCNFGWSAFDGGTIGIRSGGNGAGTYALTVDTDDSVGEPPDSKGIIYDADLTLRVTTPELRYERSVTVAPEGVNA